MILVAFARLASFFLLLSQKKETKEKAAPYRSHFACHFSGLANWGSPLRASCAAQFYGRQSETR